MHEDIEYTKEEVEHRARSAFSTIMKGLSAAASIGAALRYFGPSRYLELAPLLRWMGLRRGRSVLGTMALLGAGAVAGAGIAMFVSPRSGRDTRQSVARGFRNISRRGRELVETATHQLGGMSEGGNGGQESRRGGQEGRQTSPGTGSQQAAGSSSAGESANRPGTMGIGAENRRPG